MIDGSDAIHFELSSRMRADCFQAKGPLRYYVYEWICGDATVYVGRGCDGRYDKFYTSRKYGSKERQAFVLAHRDEFTCRYAVTNVSLCAAKEAEALLIARWQLRANGGTLFNDRIESLPALIDLSEDRRRLAQFNVPAIVPSPEKCLTNGEFYDTWLALDKAQLSDDDMIVFTGAPNCWRPLHHGNPVKGWRLDREVLQLCLPATVSEITEFAKEFSYKPSEVRGKHGHLAWGIDKGYIAVENNGPFTS